MEKKALTPMRLIQIDPGPKSPYSGSISPITGVYTAPTTLEDPGAKSETVTIRATDTAGDSATVIVTVLGCDGFLWFVTPRSRPRK